jgi:hypothetical protein
MEALVGAAASRTRRLLGLIYPRDVWWTKVGIQLINYFPRLRGEAFLSYLHPTAAVEDIIAANDLHKIAHHNGLIWQVAVFAR